MQTLSRCSRIALAAALALPLLAQASDDPVRIASVEEVASMLGKPGVAVFDANDEDVYRAGHVPGARFLPARFDAGALPADKGTLLVFYCKNPK
jgi:rhodanese-related sulfurtransferase